MIVNHYTENLKPSDRGTFVTVTRSEAVRLIESLAHQLETRNPNSGRMESFDQNGEFFSIAVSDDSIGHLPPGRVRP